MPGDAGAAVAVVVVRVVGRALRVSALLAIILRVLICWGVDGAGAGGSVVVGSSVIGGITGVGADAGGVAGGLAGGVAGGVPGTSNPSVSIIASISINLSL